MNHSQAFERNDTGILSLADLFRRDRLPCEAGPRRWLPESPASTPDSKASRPAIAPAPKPTA